MNIYQLNSPFAEIKVPLEYNFEQWSVTALTQRPASNWQNSLVVSLSVLG